MSKNIDCFQTRCLLFQQLSCGAHLFPIGMFNTLEIDTLIIVFVKIYRLFSNKMSVISALSCGAHLFPIGMFKSFKQKYHAVVYCIRKNHLLITAYIQSTVLKIIER